MTAQHTYMLGNAPFDVDALVKAVHQAMESGDRVVVSPPETATRTTALDLISRQPWAIETDMLHTIVSIAQREGEGAEAVAAKMGRQLQNTRSVTMRDGVAVVPITGPIFRYANLFTEISGATSLEVLARDFGAALQDPSVRAIVLDIDSPGGQATGIAEFAQHVRAADKPVIAYVGGSASSAAYWIATAADEVVMGSTAEVGSIGAVFGVRRGKSADLVEFVSSQSPMKRPDPDSDAGRTEMQARVDGLAQVFIEDVANYRGVSVETVLAEFGRGGVRLGANAVRLGMADRVSTLESVIAGLTGATSGGSRIMATEDNGTPVAGPKAPEITLAYLEEHHASLLDQVRAEAKEQGRQDGAVAERDRIQSVEQQLMAGHEDLIQTLKFDGKTTGAEAAVQVLAAEKQARGDTLGNLKADAPKPVADPSVDDEPGGGNSNGKTVEEKAREAWDSSESLQAEFKSFDTYLAFCKAEQKKRTQ